MKYKLTVLNLFAGVYLLGCITYTLANYGTLSEGEGWGVVGMIRLMSFGVIALLVDLVIQIILWVRNRNKQ